MIQNLGKNKIHVNMLYQSMNEDSFFRNILFFNKFWVGPDISLLNSKITLKNAIDQSVVASIVRQHFCGFI